MANDANDDLDGGFNRKEFYVHNWDDDPHSLHIFLLGVLLQDRKMEGESCLVITLSPWGP
jgi:hypothetical protein